MILKNFEINKIDLDKQKNFLFYGNNNALIQETVNNVFGKKFVGNTYNYDENEILNNKENFFNQVLNGSLFDNQKLIIISRVTDKILEVSKEISIKKIDDTVFVLKTNLLDKKSKLRKFYEENEKTICIAFFPDTEITLKKITSDFFKKIKISISQENINFIISRCNNNREYLNNELRKIELFSINRKNLSIEEIMKIIHLNENHSIYELINFCLLKNEKKTLNILNENNFAAEDTIIILRTFLARLKNILKLANDYEKNNNIELTIKNAKPPIFWKEKENVKRQLNYWTTFKIKNLINELIQIEHKVKKYSANGKNILLDFLITLSTKKSNN
tara:strand:+ start:127 stop:1125 length:999 start_codon:yes stop_codon:yes gene_type:complete